MRLRKKAALILLVLILTLSLGGTTPALANDAQLESSDLPVLPSIIEEVMDFLDNLFGVEPEDSSPGEDRTDRGRGHGDDQKPDERGPTADPDGHTRKNR
jgi:hypothetical protein